MPRNTPYPIKFPRKTGPLQDLWSAYPTFFTGTAGAETAGASEIDE